jgi:serine/threonine protein kinase
MYDPQSLDQILSTIPDPGSFGFKILEAGASNTLIITTKDGIHPSFGVPIAIKVWINRSPNQLIQEKAVEYEKKVYEDVIKLLFQEQKEPPFLKYLGSDDDGLNITTLATFIGAQRPDCFNLLRLAFCVLNVFSNDPLSRKRFIDGGGVINLMSKHFYTNFFSIFRFNWDVIQLTTRLKGLLFPEIKFVKFSDIIGNPQVSINIFREILKGLYMINKKRLVHNDLHIGNVMIQRDTGRVMIYDWDRAYCPLLGENPILDIEIHSNATPCHLKVGYGFKNLLFLV